MTPIFNSYINVPYSWADFGFGEFVAEIDMRDHDSWKDLMRFILGYGQ